jgi:hypothetical protein
MKRLLSGCVTALAVLSATPARADHSALFGTYNCVYYSYWYGSLLPYPSGFDRIHLDGYGRYYSYPNGSGGNYKIYSTKQPSINNIHFVDGSLKTWVAEYTVSNDIKKFIFTIKNNPDKGLTTRHECSRK